MKRNYPYYLFLFIITLGLLACEDDDDTKKNEASIVGDWILTTKVNSGCETPESNDSTFIACSDTSCITYSFEVDLEEDSITTIQSYVIATLDGRITTRQAGIYKVSDDKLSFCVEDQTNQTEEDVFICTDYSMRVNATMLTLRRKNSDTNCTETLLLERK
ncbi:MAG: hypothetical protein JXR10_17310 [Cyclobacteriaceae bacterium]